MYDEKSGILFLPNYHHRNYLYLVLAKYDNYVVTDGFSWSRYEVRASSSKDL